MKTFIYLVFRVRNFSNNHRTLVAFCITFAAMLAADIVFARIYEAFNDSAQYNVQPADLISADMGFAPEVWLSLLGLILGTLIIVISIASQNTPKLIDLYLADWISLLYIWLIVLSSSHAVFLLLFNNVLNRPASVVLNNYFFLSISVLSGLPYIFYILRYIKTDQVIYTLYRKNIRIIRKLTGYTSSIFFSVDKIVEYYQLKLLESLNQLNDILDYDSFREPRADIIRRISMSMQTYILRKPRIDPRFFMLTPATRQDISFRTLTTEQFREISEDRTFYEEKSLRLLGNAYIKLMEQCEFELASLCAAEVAEIGEAAVATNDEDLLDTLLVKFNTFLRFAIKHAINNNEARHLFNLAFHYARFLQHLLKHGQHERLQRSFYYWRRYSNEIFNHSVKNQALYFIVGVFASELRNLLILAHQGGWKHDQMLELLDQFLELDKPPEVAKVGVDKEQIMKSGVRIVQISLALYYLEHNEHDFVARIIDDILDDLNFLDETTFRALINVFVTLLKNSQPGFWEDTDRGNINIFYTPHKKQISTFTSLLDASIKSHTNSDQPDKV